jgi:hypothetical protein
MAKTDDIPIIREPLVGTGEAPEVRPPSVLERERERNVPRARPGNGDGPADDAGETESTEDKPFRDKAAEKIVEVADKLAERIATSDDPAAPDR